MADAIHRAVTMPDDEKRERMQRLRALVRKADVHAWVEGWLDAAASARDA